MYIYYYVLYQIYSNRPDMGWGLYYQSEMDQDTGLIWTELILINENKVLWKRKRDTPKR